MKRYSVSFSNVKTSTNSSGATFTTGNAYCKDTGQEIKFSFLKNEDEISLIAHPASDKDSFNPEDSGKIFLAIADSFA